MLKQFTLPLCVTGMLLLAACSKPVEPVTAPEPQPTEQSPSVATGDNAENALDWAGTYQGKLPCADCEGIETTLTLNADKTYQLTQHYLKEGEQPNVTSGSFSFNTANPSLIQLDDAGDQRVYFVAENYLEARSADGSPAGAELQQHYILSKVTDTATPAS